MRALRTQLDIFEHDPARLAKANRVAAETALIDVQFTATERQERHDYYLGEALRLEALARQCHRAPARRRRTATQTGATAR
ncbi:hypothetical protein [Stenotrophomonas sp. TWI819]|uniref:hypothetical protein n=1 Tax=Stenotrophomonas sp. TWI819 TaxID=3136800 RepID=UPI00320AEACF